MRRTLLWAGVFVACSLLVTGCGTHHAAQLTSAEDGSPALAATPTPTPGPEGTGGPLLPEPTGSFPVPTVNVLDAIGGIWDVDAGSSATVHRELWMAAFGPLPNRPDTHLQLVLGTLDTATGKRRFLHEINSAPGEAEGSQLLPGFHALVTVPDPLDDNVNDTVGWVVGPVTSVSFGSPSEPARLDGWTQDPAMRLLFAPGAGKNVKFTANTANTAAQAGPALYTATSSD